MADAALKEKRYVGVKETTIYGIANGGQVMGYNIFTTYLSFFFATVFGIHPTAVATMVLVTGLWDTFNDPIMGSLVDKTRTRYGKLRPYLFIVPIPLAIVTVLFFSGPLLLADVKSTAVKIVWMYLSYILWEFVYTIGDVAFWGMSASISPSPSDRARAVSSARLISGIIGGLMGPILSVLIDLSNRNVISWDLRQVFLCMGLIAGVGGMLLFSLAGIFTRERVVQDSEEPKVLDSFKFLFSDKPLMLIVAYNMLSALGSVGRVLGSYYYIMTLGFASLSIVAGLPGMIAGPVMYLFLPKLLQKFSPKQVVIGNTLFRLVIISATFFIGLPHYADPKFIIPIIAVQNMFLSMSDSVNMVVTPVMVGDTVDYMEWKTGKRNEGMSFSVLTFISKLTNTISNSIGTACIGLIGLKAIQNADNTITMIKDVNGVNSDLWLWAFFTIIPAVLGTFSIIPMFWYDLQGKKREMIRQEMTEHRSKMTREVSGGNGTEVE